MYTRASGGLGGPHTPPFFTRLLNTLHSVLYYGPSLEFQLRFGVTYIYFTFEKEYDNSLFQNYFFLFSTFYK